MGPMFSGKTVHLVGQIDKTKFIANAHMYYVNSSKDTRKDCSISSHSKILENHDLHDVERLLLTKSESLLEFYNQTLQTDLLLGYNGHSYHLFIDEAQFFPDLLEFVERLVEDNSAKDRPDITVTIAGLIADSQNKKFGQLWDVLPYCTSIKTLKSICFYCASLGQIVPGVHTLRLKSNESQVLIGDHKQYLPTCTPCFIEHSHS